MEALVIVFVFVLAVAVYVGAWLGVKYHAVSPAEELARLQEYRESLEEKIRCGQAESWDAVMMRQLADKLADTNRRLAEKTGPGQPDHPRA